MTTRHPGDNPHQGGRVVRRGPSLDTARGALILVHGRGASAEDILTLVPALGQSDFACLAPQASGSTWYPFSFLEPLERNEPGLSSGLAVLAGLRTEIEAGGVPVERTVLLGFSQGACLSLEFAARHPARYGGVIGLSGGLIGPPGTPREYPGSLAGTPVFLGCSDVDPHIPKARVEETAEVLEGMGAAVTTRLYRGMGHLVNQDELDFVRRMMKAVESD